MQGKKQRERYRRLDRAERAAIQSGLDKGRSCRQMARDLGRSPSTVADEVARNRTVSKGPGKGERVRDAPEDACPKLLSWPRCCNGCRNLRYRSCSRRWRCEYWIGYTKLDSFVRAGRVRRSPWRTQSTPGISPTSSSGR